jgi:hypothetical protein
MNNTTGAQLRAALIGLAQALATSLVVSIAFFIIVLKLQYWEPVTNHYFDNIAILLLVALSVLFGAILVLAYPLYLMINQRRGYGFFILLYTILWLIVILSGTLVLLVTI